jgi:DNA (cytosine-5)-methyltransferase 1
MDNMGTNGAVGGRNGWPTAVGIFTGCGGLDLGFYNAGFDVMVANDVWDPAVRTYQTNFPRVMMVHGDIAAPAVKSRIVEACGGRCDVMVGGPPCSAFSTSGLRDHNDPKGRLYVEYLDLVDRLRPAIIVMENVLGILKARDGESIPVINRITSGLEGLGYRAEFRILNAADFGVAQHRRRVILIATRLDAPIIFPEPTHSAHPDLFGNTRQWVTIVQAIHDLEDIPENREWGHIFTRHNPEFLDRIRKTPLNGHCGGRFRDGYRRIPPIAPSSIIKTVCWPIHYTLDRTLTPREAARIQGFPDTFSFIGNKGDVATMIGNAVPPPLAKAIGLAILGMLGAVVSRTVATDASTVRPWNSRGDGITAP